jgi:hypothetical protein
MPKGWQGQATGQFDAIDLQQGWPANLKGTLLPRGQVPPAMERSLQLLGPADATGRRQFSVGGTL